MRKAFQCRDSTGKGPEAGTFLVCLGAAGTSELGVSPEVRSERTESRSVDIAWIVLKASLWLLWDGWRGTRDWMEDTRSPQWVMPGQEPG